MAKKRKTNSKKGTCAQQQQLDDIERERTVQDEQLQQARQEAEELKELVHKLRSNIQKNDDKEGKVQQNKIDITLKANVINTARKIAYPLKCPYISTHEQLLRCTKMVGEKMGVPSEQFGNFVSLYKSTVNSAIATRRNANIQQVRKKLNGTYIYIIFFHTPKRTLTFR